MQKGRKTVWGTQKTCATEYASRRLRTNGALGTVSVFLVATLAGCSTYQRDIGYRPPLSGLPGSASEADTDTRIRGHVDPMMVPTNELIRENDDGSRTLVLRNGRHLMHHILWTLEEGEIDLFTDQILSEATHIEFRRNGRLPTDAFGMLHRHLRDLHRLFARMPMGEHTPSVIMSKVANRTYRVKLTGPAARDLRYIGYDMILEQGNWRLLWVIKG